MTPRQILLLSARNCRCYKDSLPYCPLSKLRSGLHPSELEAKLAGMSDEEIENLYEEYLLCISRVCSA